MKVLPGENSGTAHITVAEDDNTIIVIKAANDLVSPSLIDEAWEDISKADMVLLQHEIPAATNAYVIEKCAAHGVPVLLNPAPVAPVPQALLDKITYLTPNEHEAATLFAGKGKADILDQNQGQGDYDAGQQGCCLCGKGPGYYCSRL